MAPRFDPNDEAWLEDDEGDRPGCEVIIVSQHQKAGGTWEYTLKYKRGGHRVTNNNGDRFSERDLSTGKPSYLR
jgi:hypothetical protein